MSVVIDSLTGVIRYRLFWLYLEDFSTEPSGGDRPVELIRPEHYVLRRALSKIFDCYWIARKTPVIHHQLSTQQTNNNIGTVQYEVTL